MTTQFSNILDSAINEIGKLPGIGSRTALRLALHLIKADPTQVQLLTESISKLKTELQHCKVCHNVSDAEHCAVCSNPKRNREQICVVQDIRDVIAIENTHQYNGVYHVLGGIISPIDGIGPGQLTLGELFQRVETEAISEVILALPATTEGDTTNFYIYKHLFGKVGKITTIARGVGIGEELEFTDEVTLGRSLVGRREFDSSYGVG